MAAYRRVDDLRSPAGWLPVHWDQLRAQRSVSSMGSLYLYLYPLSWRPATGHRGLPGLPQKYLARTRFRSNTGPKADSRKDGIDEVYLSVLSGWKTDGSCLPKT